MLITDSTFIGIDILNHIPGSISQLCGRGDRKRKQSNIERLRICKAMTNPKNRGEPTKKNITCPLCLQTSHHQFICKVFENKYHIKPLLKNDDDARSMLAKSLPVLYGSLIFNRKIGDTRQILKDFPKVKMAIVIHKRYYINHDITLVRHTDNICI